MHVTLIHNPGAGGGEPGAKALRKLIRSAGHKVRYHSAKEKGLREVLKKRCDFVAVAGGDGTVGRVARRLAGKGRPIAVLPMGTANNIAHSLGIHQMKPEELIRSWPDAERVTLDTGRARGPWGKRRFVEGLGFGLFAWTMPQADDSKQLAKAEKPRTAVEHVLDMLLDRLEHYKPHRLKATLDERDLSGDYVMFEAMNLPYIGPNLHLAPRVQLGDGRLHVVVIREGERDKLRKYLTSWREGRRPRVKLPSFRGRHLRIERNDYHVHVDDRMWPDRRKAKALRPAAIEVKIDPGTLTFLVPPRS